MRNALLFAILLGLAACKAGAGERCEKHDECIDGLFCDRALNASNRVCTNLCEADDECPDGSCVGGYGGPGNCLPECSADGDCPDGSRCAVDGYCSATCTNDDECYGYSRCMANLCVEP